MGEAKRRKQRDPYYGKIPKGGKGIVISEPISVNIPDNIISVNAAAPNPDLLRRSVLFWERIEWPLTQAYQTQGSAETDFLTSAGILSRPSSIPKSGKAADLVATAFLDRFIENEKREPGAWCMAEGPESFLLRGGKFEQNRAPLLSLYRAIPLPDHDVPLPDLLEFKHKRLDQVHRLTLAIDQFYTNALKAEDFEFELNRQVREIDACCMEIIKVGRESGVKFKLSDWSINFSTDLGDILKKAIVGGAIGSQFGLPQVGALLGAGTSSVKIGRGLGVSFGVDKKKLHSSPYRFVSSLHNEPI